MIPTMEEKKTKPEQPEPTPEESRKSLFAGLKEAAEQGREDRGTPKKL
jgi:hypothetical protein